MAGRTVTTRTNNGASSNLVASDYTRTYTSFSGCDIVCAFGNKVIGELQAITYSIQRVVFGM